MDSSIKVIKLIYEDGTEKEIEKGFISSIQELEGGEVEAKFYFANISGEEVYTVVMATVQLGIKLGYFGKD